MLEIFATISSKFSIEMIEIAILALVLFFAALIFFAKK